VSGAEFVLNKIVKKREKILKFGCNGLINQKNAKFARSDFRFGHVLSNNPTAYALVYAKKEQGARTAIFQKTRKP
jgi:hypothetical protein